MYNSKDIIIKVNSNTLDPYTVNIKYTSWTCKYCKSSKTIRFQSSGVYTLIGCGDCVQMQTIYSSSLPKDIYQAEEQDCEKNKTEPIITPHEWEIVDFDYNGTHYHFKWCNRCAFFRIP